MTRIVILGGGFAGASCAQELERLLEPGECEIVLLNRTNFFVFTPLLVEAGTGSLEPRHAVVPLREFLGRTRLLTAEVIAIDQDRRTVRYRVIGDDDESETTWDQLVLALGSITREPPVPGLSEYAREMKSLSDAVMLRDWAIQLLEMADADPASQRELLHLVVVGANYTGVEVAGELAAFQREAVKAYPRLDPAACRVTLVELSSRILPALDADLADFATAHLRRRGLEVILETGVRRIEPHRVELTDGRILATRTVIWCAGIRPHPLALQAGLPCDERGAVICDDAFRVQGRPGVWSAGDVARVPDGKGGSYPPTAQHAMRAGVHLARNLARFLRGEDPRSSRIPDLGSLTALGCRTAVARVLGVRLQGFPAWFLWRTVYLLKMPGLSRRVRVALDWTMDLLFPRPIVQLGVHRAVRSREDGTRN